MADMIDMKAKNKKSTCSPVECDQPEYPWGLSINLENESIDKLGVNFTKLSIGQKIKLICEAEIVGLSADENKKDTNKTIRLQITKMSKPQVSSRMEAGKNLLNSMRK